MIVGTQWGDEGKGEETHRRTKDADLVVRCQGGNNAGHTTVVDGQEVVLHLLPSSTTSGKPTGIGAGVVIDPFALVNEVSYVQTFGVKPLQHLTIDARCGLVMVYHRVMDMAKEIIRSRGGKKIGTTARGIGPAYADVADRSIIRISDFMNPSRFQKLLEQRLEEKTRILQTMGITADEWEKIFIQLRDKEITANQRILSQGLITGADLDYTRFLDYTRLTQTKKEDKDRIGFNVTEVAKAYFKAHGYFLDYVHVGDVSRMVREAIRDDKQAFIEGAQGAHLDWIFGTFPYVTSSSTIAGGACTGLGIGPGLIGTVRGVTKAYTTRVGNGPFPTVMEDETAAKIRGTGKEIGDEYGASTGRPRDCGWFDATIVRSGCAFSGVTRVTLTKLDKLSGVSLLLIGKSWQVRDTEYLFTPEDYVVAEDPDLKVNHITVGGWEEDISGIRSWDDLPANARFYVETIEKLINQEATQPIIIDRIGVGPGPDQFIDR